MPVPVRACARGRVGMPAWACARAYAPLRALGACACVRARVATYLAVLEDSSTFFLPWQLAPLPRLFHGHAKYHSPYIQLIELALFLQWPFLSSLLRNAASP